MTEHRETVGRLRAQFARCGFAPQCERRIGYLYATALAEQTNDAWCAFYVAVRGHVTRMTARMRAKSPADVEALELLVNDDFGQRLFSRATPEEERSSISPPA